MKKLLIIITALLVFTSTISNAQQSSAPSFIRDSLDSYVERALRDWQLPGLAICIVKGDEIILKGYGVQESGKNVRIDENTLFMIGSNTKAMTATALAMLQDRKKLSLDDKVVKWLPSFTMKDPWVTKELNLRDLLCHRIGMETFQGDFMYWTSNLDEKQVMEKFGRLTPAYSFRSKWGYTNASFVVAGAVICAASGKSWADFLTDSIFRPLGMNRTIALSKNLPDASNKASAHTLNQDQQLVVIPYCNIDNLGPAGSVSSSVSDMSKWVTMLLKNGKFNDKQVVSSNGISQTWFPNSVLSSGGHMFNKVNYLLYGLGWMLNDYNGKRVISHTGGVNGFVTSVTLIPEEKLGIIVLTNSDHNGLYEAVKSEIMDAYLNLPYRNYSNIYLTSTKQQRLQSANNWKKKFDTVAMHKNTTLPLSAYAGDYTHDVYGAIKITSKTDHLDLSFEHHPALLGKLEPLGGDRFICTYNDPVFGRKIIPFKTENGKVKSMTLSVADFVEFTTYEFVKK
ncbi:MAG TPA: serine hydrolase [Chitinophagaceae bacterium]